MIRGSSDVLTRKSMQGDSNDSFPNGNMVSAVPLRIAEKDFGRFWDFVSVQCNNRRQFASLYQGVTFRMGHMRDGRIAAAPERSGIGRPIRQDEARRIWKQFWRTSNRSWHPGNYHNTSRNASYILTLMFEFDSSLADQQTA